MNPLTNFQVISGVLEVKLKTLHLICLSFNHWTIFGIMMYNVNVIYCQFKVSSCIVSDVRLLWTIIFVQEMTPLTNFQVIYGMFEVKLIELD